MTSDLKDKPSRQDWMFADTLNAKDFENQIGSTVNRLQRFIRNQTMRSMFGQPTVSLDLGRALEEGSIILVSLATERAKVSNMIALNQDHMAIWKELYARPELSRITEERVALDTKPLSHEERLFVTFLILHLSVVYRATKAKMFVHIEGLAEDVKSFFSLPIPRDVWNAIKSSQEKDFVSFIEKLVSERVN